MCPDSVPGGGCNSIGIRTCVTHTCDTALNSTFSSFGSLVHIASDCHRRMRLCSTRHRSLSDAASARRSYASSDVVAPFHRALVPHARIHSTRAYAPTVLCRSTVHSSVSFSRLRLRESVIVPHARQSESLSTYSWLYFYSPLRFLPCSRMLSLPIYVCPSVSMLTIALDSCTPCVTHPSYLLYATRI